MAKSSSRAAEGLDASLPISEQAFYWIAFLESGEATDEDYAALDVWLDTDERHGPALRDARLLWQDTGAALSLPAREGPASPFIRARTASRPVLPFGRHWVAAAGLLAACLGVGLFMIPFAGLVPQEQVAPSQMAARYSYSTAIAEVRRVALEDGSAIVLGGNSVVEVTLRSDRRDALLLQGQAFFEISPDPDKPFTGDAGSASLTVLGTAFDVRRGPGETTVSVVSGTVSVRSAAAVARKVLTAGQRLAVDEAGRIGPLQRFEAAEVLGWQELRFFFEDARLEDLVADLNRYSQPPIALADDGLRDINVSASFHLDQSDAMLASLVAALSLELVEEDDRRILRRPG
jgi:transmembrane sensor